MGIFSDRLKTLRLKRELSQQQLSDELDVSKSSISMYERGEREPSFETLESIADFFNVDMNYLIGWTDAPTDWEQIANKEGICQPNDGNSNPKDWYEMKMAADQDHDLEVAGLIKRFISDIRFEQLASAYTQLNSSNKNKVIKYSENLLNIQEAEDEQGHLIPNAAHQRTDLTKDELNDKTRNKHDDDIMDDPNF